MQKFLLSLLVMGCLLMFVGCGDSGDTDNLFRDGVLTGIQLERAGMSDDVSDVQLALLVSGEKSLSDLALGGEDTLPSCRVEPKSSHELEDLSPGRIVYVDSRYAIVNSKGEVYFRSWTDGWIDPLDDQDEGCIKVLVLSNKTCTIDLSDLDPSYKFKFDDELDEDDVDDCFKAIKILNASPSIQIADN